MKLIVDHKTLVKALERGAMAALSHAAQKDSSNFAKIIQSVRITVDENFTVESGTKFLGTKWTVDATAENGFDVKEKGQILVPAKPFYDWASKQSNCKNTGADKTGIFLNILKNLRKSSKKRSN